MFIGVARAGPPGAVEAGADRESGSRREPVWMTSRITIDPEICGGRPCIRGLRVRVKDVLELLSSGASVKEILEDFPYLEAEDIDAALLFEASQTGGI